MKILHFADLHLDTVTRDNATHAMEQIATLAEREKPDLIVNAGDLAWKRGAIAPWVALALREFHVRLGRVAPVIVVAGNHDLGAATDVGTVMGALAESAGGDNIILAESAQVLPSLMGFPRIICLPYPSRARFLARHPECKADEVNARMSGELIEAINELSWGDPSLLIFHGSIAGARSDSEQVMSTEIDLVLDEAKIPACITAVLCGHIHRHQQIGRAVYPGSPYPITFAEERFPHGVVMWEDGSPRFVELAPKFPLVTIDRRGKKPSNLILPSVLIDNDINPDAVIGAKVRMLVTECPEIPGLRDVWRDILITNGAVDAKVQIEPIGRERRSIAEIRHDATLADLIALYGQTRPDLNGLVPRVAALAEGLEGRLPADVRMRQKAAGYELRSLRWSNWKSHGEGSIEIADCGSTISIEGDNATGKSNLAEIECFTLYGRTPRGRVPLGDLVRKGENEATVTALFSVEDGQFYTIVRRLKVNAKGVGMMDLQIYIGGGTVATLGTARETQALIESLVGPFELYVATRFASQGEIDRLLDLTPSELAETLQSALATEMFEHREKVGREELQAAQRAEESHEASLGQWREEASHLEERELEVIAAETILQDARERAKRVESEAAEAERAARVLQERLNKVTDDQRIWDELEEECEGARAALYDLREERETQHAIVARAEEAEREVETSKAREELAALEQGRALRAEREAALRVARETLARAERAHASHLEVRAARIAECDHAIEHAEARVATERDHWKKTKSMAEERLSDLKARAGLIEQTPFGEKCVTAACPLIEDAAKALRTIPEATAWISDHERMHLDRLATLEGDMANAKHARAEVADHPDERLVELQAELDSTIKAVQRAKDALAESTIDEVALVRAKRAVARLEECEAKVMAGKTARAVLAQIAKPLADAEARHARLAERMGAAGPRPDGLAISGELKEAEARLAEASEDLKSERCCVELSAAALGKAQAEAARSAEAVTRLGLAAEESERLANARMTAQVYVEAMGRGGIPYLMLSRALPALESYANHFLCGDLSSGLTLEIADSRKTQAGDERQELEIRYSNAFGTHPISAASGFERTAIGYALRAALAQVQADAAGVQIGHWIADEGWGVFDESNLVHVAQPMIRRLSERFGRVILISHQAAIREVCETRLTVIGDPVNGSRLVGAREGVAA